ncbi:hypothetical protein [Actinocrispum wychmicini]|uniref:PPE family protein n=1 Tax=Actinocrispum wychmicini TaxID=1213861 RepID=A0A4V2S914_9PSEU|nr:hypothetical protein [Actinocrispum wychmicini]TCO65640.1 hypothetical protein EV192_1011432 [Actinocrispum wychmicini]
MVDRTSIDGGQQAPTPTDAQVQAAQTKFNVQQYQDEYLCAELRKLVKTILGQDPNSVDTVDPAALANMKQGLYPRAAPAGPGVVYRGIPHQKLYDSVTQGADAGQIGDMASAWQMSSDDLIEASQSNAAQVLAGSEIAWQGQGGDQARAAVASLTNQAGQVGHASMVSAQLYQQQANALAQARNTIPKPPEPPFDQAAAQRQLSTVTDPVANAKLAQQQYEQFAAQQQAHDQAATIVELYDRVVTQTSRNQPGFAPPPPPPPPGPGPGPHPGGPASPGGGSGSGSGVGHGQGFAGGASGQSGPGGGAPGASGGVPGQAGFPSLDGQDGRGGGAPVSPSSSDFGSGSSRPPGGLPFGAGGGYPGGSAGGDGFGGGMVGPGGGFAGGGFDAARSGYGSGGGGRSGGYGQASGGAGGSGGARGSGGAGGSGGDGARSGAGALAAEEAARQRGMTGARGAAGAPGGMPPGAARGEKGEDDEHKRASYLLEPDTDGLFGADQRVPPPVIGG